MNRNEEGILKEFSGEKSLWKQVYKYHKGYWCL